MKDKRPILGITMGDPAGIGPEVAVKALETPWIYEVSRPLIIGNADVIRQAVRISGKTLQVRPVSGVREAAFSSGIIEVLDMQNIDASALEYGRVSEVCGKAAFQAVVKAIELAMAREIHATVTAPINKEAVNLAGYHFSGHTEIYAHFTHTRDYTMMLAEGNLRVVHVSTHVSLRQACDLVTRERVLKMIALAHDACRDLGIAHPRIGVAGLNPHSGENGMFGWEEQKEIIPAIREAKSGGIDAEGPVPADTLFSKANGGMYDIVVAMYHDQGHIPLKVLGFQWNGEEKKWMSVNGVNITLGLPIIRTSVDHGTAFDLAGRGVANEKSMVSAIEYAVKLAHKKVTQ